MSDRYGTGDPDRAEHAPQQWGRSEPALEGESAGQRALRLQDAAPVELLRLLRQQTGADLADPGPPGPTGFRAIRALYRWTHTGVFGHAWRVAHDSNPATLAAYLCDLPGYRHRWWRHHLLSSCHLRDLPNFPPAQLERPEMTHEVMILALDPEPPPELRDPASWRPITKDTIHRAVERDRAPTNRVVFDVPHLQAMRCGLQLALPADSAMVRLTEKLAEALVDGTIVPERDDAEGGLAGWQESVRELARSIGVLA